MFEHDGLNITHDSIAHHLVRWPRDHDHDRTADHGRPCDNHYHGPADDDHDGPPNDQSADHGRPCCCRTCRDLQPDDLIGQLLSGGRVLPGCRPRDERHDGHRRGDHV